MTEAQLPDPALPASLAHLGGLIGDPVRAAILLHLSDGSRRPAGELATLAGASQQAASAHLARLTAGGLLRVEAHGRNRFYAIASGEIAETIETLANWLDQPRREVTHDPKLREARLCYDHLAGRVGVAVFDRMADLGFLVLEPDGIALGEVGRAWCRRVGLSLEPRAGSRRPMTRLCLDWTERRHHLGGHLGAALTRHMLDADLLRPGPLRRALQVTARGSRFLQAELGLSLSCRPTASDLTAGFGADRPRGLPAVPPHATPPCGAGEG